MRVCSLCRRCNDDAAVVCIEGCHAPLSEMREGDPEMIAGYRLEFLLRYDIKGNLYRARHKGSDHSCLITVHYGASASSGTFLREAKIASSLFHPNIVDIYETGVLDSDGLFVVAEDPDGRTLRDLLAKEGVPELLTTVEIVRQTAEALHALNQSGLAHGAIRPENIILTTDNTNRMLVRIQNPDLGGVVERSIISNKFLIDSALDTLRYFAPEQCSGEGASARSDIYSLGIVMYEMLAGVPPFDAPKASGLIEKHRRQLPPEVRIDNFDLRMLVTHALMEALQKHPATRQSSADLFARQLRHIEQLATHVSTPPPAGVVPPEPRRASARMNVTLPSTMPPEVPAIVAPVEIPAVIATSDVISVELEVEDRPAATIPEAVAEPAIIDSALADPVIEIIASNAFADQDAVEVAPPPVTEIVTNGKPQTRHHRVSRSKLQKKKLRAKTASRIAEVEDPAPHCEPESAVEEKLAEETAPKKIEWEQPEDDIPTIEEVLEVLSSESEQVPVQTPVEQVPPVVTESIVLAKPQQDAALVERSVVQARASEPAREMPSERSRVEEKLISASSKTEIIRRELPVSKVIAKAQVKTRMHETHETVEKPRVEVPAMKTEEVTRAGMPVVKAAASAPVIRVPEKKPKEVPPPIKPKKLTPKPSDYRISWMKDVMGEKAKIEAERVPVVRDELEEITVVRARSKPIRIELDQSGTQTIFSPYKRFSAHIPEDEGFRPTILGDKSPTGQNKEPGLASLYDLRIPRSLPDRRMLAIVAVVAVLGFAFIFGDDLAGKYLQASSAVETASTEKPAEQTSLPSVVPASTSTASVKSDRVGDRKSDDGQFKAQYAKDSLLATREKAPDTESKSDRSKTKGAPVKERKPTAPAAAQPERKQKPAADKKPQQHTAKPTVPGRPRIVKDPKN